LRRWDTEHRRSLRTRRNTRALTSNRQAIFALIWMRTGQDIDLLARSLRRAADDGWTYVILDGKVFAADRCATTVIGTKNKPVHAWYSGKHRCFGGNIQAVIRPDGLPLWTSEVTEGRLHDSTAAAHHDIYAALYWAADELDLPTLADAGYHGAGPGIYTPVKLPNTGGGHLTVDHQAYNQLLRSLRAPGERGFALLTGRWKALRHITASPSRIGHYVRAALALTHYEHRHTTPC
jgi:hypothetical protein